jgi:hypothetical protein
MAEASKLILFLERLVTISTIVLTLHSGKDGYTNDWVDRQLQFQIMSF